MLIDTHAHLNFKSFNKDLPEVIDKANKAGIEKIIIPGAKIDSSKKAVEIAQIYDNCFATVGIHPHHIDELAKLGKAAIEEELEKLIINKKVVAVGEIGLDYHEYKDYPSISVEIKKQQKELLETQVSIAQEYDLPIIFHCRNAYDDQLDIIKDQKLTGVFHCFGGEKKHLKKILDMGFYIGFDGNITYPENSNLGDMVKYTPLDRLLIETDSPYLTPIPRLGERNSPANLSFISFFISRIFKRNESDIADITSQNAVQLFNFKHVLC